MTNRVVLNLNTKAVEKLSLEYVLGDKVSLRKGKKSVLIAVTQDDGYYTYTKDKYMKRLGTKINEKLASELGLKRGQRYTIQRANQNKWYRLVPHSKVTATNKGSHFDVPVITVG